MDAKHLKKSIAELISRTNNKRLLQLWKEQIEWDLLHKKEMEAFSHKLHLISRDYSSNADEKVVSMEDFPQKKRQAR